ncbi:putative glycosyltransferase [Quercus suber]|uniref:Glycosyltransferase n=1 Tax=Quercus suber TaxID=58331 RepID=A0AAW0JYZ7_QUESU
MSWGVYLKFASWSFGKKSVLKAFQCTHGEENVNQFQNLETQKRKKIRRHTKYNEAIQFQTHEIFSSTGKEAIGQAVSSLECCFYTDIKFFNFISNQTRNPTNNVLCCNVILNPRNYVNYNEVYHDRDTFVEDYKEMNRSFKIYVYPHRRNDPFANVLLPVGSEPGGNYASESYFKKIQPRQIFSSASLNCVCEQRHDPELITSSILVRSTHIGIGQVGLIISMLPVIPPPPPTHFFSPKKMQNNKISISWLTLNKSSPLAHEDLKKLAFFAGKINSPVREKLLQVWRNDTEIFAHLGRLTTPYADELLGSKFCLHVKGFEVNTARIADSLYYGCVPVIIANYYDLPFADILNWKSFSINVATLDIPLLKKILKRFSFEEYLMLQRNALKVRKHFQWHLSPVDYDAFYMVMYELWLRQSSVRLPLNDFVHPN